MELSPTDPRPKSIGNVRLFSPHNAEGERGDVFAALVESPSKPTGESVDSNKVRRLFRLSKREIDGLNALISGATDKQIATQLMASVETVRADLKSIRAKLGAKTRTAVVSIVHALQTETAGAMSPYEQK